VTASKK
jgi:hypothetical protein